MKSLKGNDQEIKFQEIKTLIRTLKVFYQEIEVIVSFKDLEIIVSFQQIESKHGGSNPGFTIFDTYGCLFVNTKSVFFFQIVGFLNFFLWTTNLWFLYKETRWFAGASAQGGQQLPS